MFSQVTYNVIIERFKAYASGHYLIKRFSHGQIDVADIMKDAEYAWMHVVPVSMNPATGTRSFSFDIIFADMPRDKEEKTEYQRESLSDCIRLAEDLLAEIQNGYTIFGRDVELEEGATITPFMEEYTHVLTGVTLSLTMTFSWDWNACDIPADWSAGGSGSGGTGGGVASLVLKTNGTPNIIQNILDLVDGTGMDIIDLGDGRVQFTSTGGGATDFLRCRGFQNGARAKHPEKFMNMKAECYFKLAEMIEQNKVIFPIAHRDTIVKELDMIRRRNPDADSRLSVTSKEEIQRLHGMSPDYADMIMMRMYFELHPNYGKYSYI